MLVRKYLPEDAQHWDAFIANSKNATFLYKREFMDYHSDRFDDFSLMIFNGLELIAVLPSHLKQDVIYSHLGLTYGGLILTDKSKLTTVIGILRSVLQFLNQHKIVSLFIKSIPSIYHKLPSDELEYAAFLAGAVVERRDSLSVIDNNNPLKFTKSRLESIRRGQKNQLVIVEDGNFDAFWNQVLIPNLRRKHQANPVHSLEEISKLNQRFPENIRHFNVYSDGEIVAGTTVFVSDQVAHPQYVSGLSNKNETGALDYLYSYLIKDVFADKKFFDFGISNEDNGMKLNEGLVFWKESFGARTLTQDFYRIPTNNYFLLDSVIL